MNYLNKIKIISPFPLKKYLSLKKIIHLSEEVQEKKNPYKKLQNPI